jgi:hypothetical protein
MKAPQGGMKGRRRQQNWRKWAPNANYGVITNDVGDYIYLLVGIAHIICNLSK